MMSRIHFAGRLTPVRRRRTWYRAATAAVLCIAFGLTSEAGAAALPSIVAQPAPPSMKQCTHKIGVASIGIAFDGVNLLLSCTNTNAIDIINPSDGSFVGQVDAPVGYGTGYGALAYDSTRHRTWACRLYDDGDHDALTSPDIVLIDASLGGTGAVSTPIHTGADGARCFDGLAFDAADAGGGGLWHSADQECLVGHTSANPGSGNNGVLLAAPNPNPATVCPAKLGSGGKNSGIAVGGTNLFLATPVGSSPGIWQTGKAFSTAPTQFESITNHSEDLECDPVTFPGKDVIWMTTNEDRTLRPYELPPGSCGLGGAPLATMTHGVIHHGGHHVATGVIKVCKIAGKGIPEYGSGNPQVSTKYPFTVNGTTFDIGAGADPGGQCKVVGVFPQGQQVTITETPRVGTAVSQISVDPPAHEVPNSKDIPGQTVKVTAGANDVTHVRFTDKAVPTGNVEICKETTGNFSPPLPLFVDYVVPGIPGVVHVPTGGCISTFAVTAGPDVKITEQPTYGMKVAGCETLPSAALLNAPCSGNTASIKVNAAAPQDESHETVLTFTNKAVLVKSPWPTVSPHPGPVHPGPVLPGPDNTHLTPGVVTGVAGGDVINVKTGGKRHKGIHKFETVRLAGIDTPIFRSLAAPQQCGGSNATNAMLHLGFGSAAKHTDGDAHEDDTAGALGRGVYVDTGGAAPRRDRRGRLVGYVEDARTGDDLARREIASGWAKLVARKRGSYRYGLYAAAQKQARKARRGVWSLCGGDFHLRVRIPKTGPIEGPDSDAP